MIQKAKRYFKSGIIRFSTMKEKIERKNREDATLPSSEKLQNINGDTLVINNSCFP